MGLILTRLPRRKHAEGGDGSNGPTGYEVMQLSCRNLRKPILDTNPGGALRYAWLRAPPSRHPNPTRIPRTALTYKSPYEGGQRRSAVPTILSANAVAMVGTLRFAHPTIRV